MKLERLHEYILITVTILLGIAFALYAGLKVGQGQAKTVIIILAAIPLVLAAVKYTSKLWILLPLSFGISGTIIALPIALPLQDLIEVYVFLVFLVLKALKIVRKKQVFRLLDVLLLINVIYLGFVFCRNPVGALGLETERIGGRSYFDVVGAFLAYWVLSQVTITPQQAFKLPIFMVIAPIFESFAGFLADIAPNIVEPLSRLYSSFANQIDSSVNTPVGEFGENRYTYLANAGMGIPTTQSCYFNPTSFINPLFIGRFLLFVGSVIMLLLSGYRSNFVIIIVTLLFSGYLRSGSLQIIKITLFALPVLTILILGQNTIFNLPIAVQRTISFMPGHWDQTALDDANGSTEWRVEMWKDALTTNLYIRDKIFGDGFGVDRKTYEAVQYAEANHITLRIKAEASAIMGTFHNGPISTIRYVGYIGLVFYYILIIVIIGKAWDLVQKTKNTQFFPLALLICIPAILHPFFFTFIFGRFDGSLTVTILSVGMLNMLRESLSEFQQQADPNQQRIPFAQVTRSNLACGLERWNA